MNWRAIPEFSLYEIDRYGRIRNKKTKHILRRYSKKDGQEHVVLYEKQERYYRSPSKLAKEVWGNLYLS